MEATTGLTEQKPWEIAWGELCWEGARWKRGYGGRMGNRGKSLGDSSVGRSEMKATTGWTQGKPWEIARGELRWEGPRRKRRQGGRRGNGGKSFGESSGGKERDGSVDMADGGETVANSLRRAPRWEGARRKRRQGGRRGNCGK